MKKSSLVSIVAHSFVFIVLSFHQNLDERTPRELVPQSEVEIVFYSGEAALPELHKVEIIQNMPTDPLVANLTTASESSVNINKTSQINDNNVPIPNNEFGRSPVSITSATPKKAFPKSQNVERDRNVPTNKANSKLSHTLEEKYFQQYQSEKTKNTYATVSIHNRNQVKSGFGQSNTETIEVAKTLIPNTEMNTIVKLSLPSLKPSRIESVSPQSTQEKLTINESNSEASKKGVPSDDINFKSTAKPPLLHAPESPKLAMAPQEKSNLDKVLSDKKKSLVKNGGDIQIEAKGQKFNYTQTFETLAQSRPPNIVKNNNLPQSRKVFHPSGMKKTLKQSTQASCKRTLTVTVAPRQQVRDFRSKELLTIKDLLGRQPNWYTERRQVTISYLLGTNTLVRQNTQANVSISELLKSNARVTPPRTTVCIE